MNAITHDHGDQQFKPNTTVAAIVHHNGKFLLVEEIENGNTVYNQPAGHIETDENLVDAAKRELEEETGLNLKPECLSGIYYFHRPEFNLYFLRFCFVFEVDNLLPTKPQDDEIIDCHWLTLEQIESKQPMLRSAMVLECVQDYLNGQRIPLSAIKSNL